MVWLSRRYCETKKKMSWGRDYVTDTTTTTTLPPTEEELNFLETGIYETNEERTIENMKKNSQGLKLKKKQRFLIRSSIDLEDLELDEKKSKILLIPFKRLKNKT